MLVSSSNSIGRLLILVVTVLLLLFMLFSTTKPPPEPQIFDGDYVGDSVPATPGPAPVDTDGAPVKQPPPKSTKFDNNVESLEPEPEPITFVDTRKLNPKQRLNQEMQDILTWDPPTYIEHHYPPYDIYINHDYDANRWEGFPMNNEFYVNGTIFGLPSDKSVPSVYHPYPDYSSKERRAKYAGEYVPCLGPRGKRYDKNAGDLMMAYRSIPEGFPAAGTGSAEALGLDTDVCFDRFGRMSPYGYPNPSGVNDLQKEIEWETVRWGKLQNECLTRNIDRYRNGDIPNMFPKKTMPVPAPQELHKRDAQPEGDEAQEEGELHKRAAIPKDGNKALRYQSRTAVLIRTWDDYQYAANDIQAIRSLVTELALLSGGEYQVFLFVQVKDLAQPLWNDPPRYFSLLNQYVPEELRDMAILWTEVVCQEWYPKVGEWSVYYQQFMPVQWFARTHPQFDYIWNWEMDARYLGHHYHFLEQISAFALKQPRKYLWERNSRYYFPNYHGSFENFTKTTNAEIAKGNYKTPVWGPQPWEEGQKVLGPTPPRPQEQDNFEWGVGEEADLITLLPLWDPNETVWAQKNKMFNYKPSDPDFEGKPLALQKPFEHIPRRVFINTVVRFSTKMLDAMHEENLLGRSMASEIWPGSIALQHGLKAVYAPHPIWMAHKWPGFYLENVFNPTGWGAGADGSDSTERGHGSAYKEELDEKGIPQQGTGPNREGRTARWGSEYDAPYSPDREHNFAGWSWYFWTDFPKVIYRRWMGMSSSFKIVTISGPFPHDTMEGAGGPEWEDDFGRMCLPGMILHPIKRPAIDPDGDSGAYEVLGGL